MMKKSVIIFFLISILSLIGCTVATTSSSAPIIQADALQSIVHAPTAVIVADPTATVVQIATTQPDETIAVATIQPTADSPIVVNEEALAPNCLGKDAAFAPFADVLHIECDDTMMYIEADSVADHDMMIGITAWNQQVPIPQSFEGNNAWQIPLNPVWADETTPSIGQGPIAVAINGVMIYNPTQQSGIYDHDHDPYLIGELDTCGGHSGRADDYHYHIAPNCIIDELSEAVSDYAQPIGYAMDGYPIFGYFNPDGSEPTALDECGGEFDENGNYHYHAQYEYPYVNHCFHGAVDLSLQPRTHPIRPAGEPIHVEITDFYTDADGWIHMEYLYQATTHSVNYKEDVSGDGCYLFEFIDDVNGSTSGQQERYCGGDAPPKPK